MKASEFVKKHGLVAVAEAVKAAPIDHDFQSTDLEPKFANDGSVIGFDCKVYTISHAEVKRIVESHELVESYGGLSQSRRWIERTVFKLSDSMIALKKAITDVESCL